MKKTLSIFTAFSLLLPSFLPGQGAAGKAAGADPGVNTNTKEMSLLEVMESSKEFEFLVDALNAGGLALDVHEEGPLTIFAPTNEAFHKLPDETLKTLMLPPNQQMLRNVLTYHILLEEMDLGTVRDHTFETMYGPSLTLRFGDGELRIGDAIISGNVIEAKNGRIYPVASVLVPQTL